MDKKIILKWNERNLNNARNVNNNDKKELLNKE